MKTIMAPELHATGSYDGYSWIQNSTIETDTLWRNIFPTRFLNDCHMTTGSLCLFSDSIAVFETTDSSVKFLPTVQSAKP